MLALALFVAFTVNPTPAPAPTPKLKEIVHVHASAACAELATHANSAIGAALVNDAVLPQMIGGLRKVNLDGDDLSRVKGLEELGRYAVQLTEQAIAGDREVKRLRALAAKSTDPQRKKDLTAFADALGGALWRQHKIARDLNGFISAMDYQDMAKLTEGQSQMNEALFGTPDGRNQAPNDTAPLLQEPERKLDIAQGEVPGSLQRLTDNEMAASAANDFTSRLPAISDDEGRAADFLPGATSGC